MLSPLRSVMRAAGLPVALLLLAGCTVGDAPIPPTAAAPQTPQLAHTPFHENAEVTVPIRGSCPSDGRVVAAYNLGLGTLRFAPVRGDQGVLNLPAGTYLFLWVPVSYPQVLEGFGITNPGIDPRVDPGTGTIAGTAELPAILLAPSDASSPSAALGASCSGAIYNPNSGNNNDPLTDALLNQHAESPTSPARVAVGSTSLRLNPITVGNHASGRIRVRFLDENGQPISVGGVKGFRIQPLTGGILTAASHACASLGDARCRLSKGLLDGILDVGGETLEFPSTNPGLWLIELKAGSRVFNAAAQVAGTATVEVPARALRPFAFTYTIGGGAASGSPRVTAAQAGWALASNGRITNDLQVVANVVGEGRYAFLITAGGKTTQVEAECSGGRCVQVSRGSTVLQGSWHAPGGTGMLVGIFATGSATQACVRIEARALAGGPATALPAQGCFLLPGKEGDGSTWVVATSR